MIKCEKKYKLFRMVTTHCIIQPGSLQHTSLKQFLTLYLQIHLNIRLVLYIYIYIHSFNGLFWVQLTVT